MRWVSGPTYWEEQLLDENGDVTGTIAFATGEHGEDYWEIRFGNHRTPDRFAAEREEAKWYLEQLVWAHQ